MVINGVININFTLFRQATVMSRMKETGLFVVSLTVSLQHFELGVRPLAYVNQMPSLKRFRWVGYVSFQIVTQNTIFLVLHFTSFKIFRLNFPKCGFFYAALYCIQLLSGRVSSVLSCGKAFLSTDLSLKLCLCWQAFR